MDGRAPDERGGEVGDRLLFEGGCIDAIKVGSHPLDLTHLCQRPGVDLRRGGENGWSRGPRRLPC